MELLGSGCTGIFRTNHTEALISENADCGGHTLVGHDTGDDHGIDPHIVEDLWVVCSKADAVCGLIYNDLVFERGKLIDHFCTVVAYIDVNIVPANGALDTGTVRAVFFQTRDPPVGYFNSVFPAAVQKAFVIRDDHFFYVIVKPFPFIPLSGFFTLQCIVAVFCDEMFLHIHDQKSCFFQIQMDIRDFFHVAVIK